MREHLVVASWISAIVLIVVLLNAIAYKAGQENPYPRPTVTVTVTPASPDFLR